MAELRWPDGEEAYPAQHVIRFEADVPATKLWTDAELIRLTATDRAEILDLTRRLHAALGARDADAASELLLTTADDLARLSGEVPSAQCRAGQRHSLANLMATDGFGLAPLDEANLYFHLVAGRRLVWVTHDDYAPAVRAHEDCGFRLPIYVARLQGQWRILR